MTIDRSPRTPNGATRKGALRPPPAAPESSDVMAAIQASRVVIEPLAPLVDGGRWPARAAVGQPLPVAATIFCDGHDQLAARVLWYSAATGRWRAWPLQHEGNDHWTGVIHPDQQGPHRLVIEAWIDSWGSFRHELHKKVEAGLDVGLELQEGAQLLRAFAQAASWHGEAVEPLQQLCARLDAGDAAATQALLLDEQTARLVQRSGRRDFLARAPGQLIDVERRQAGFASWYELFPRSQLAEFATHGTFDDVIGRLPAIRAMGFDVLYFPPIHPIGRSHRKGRNNSLKAHPGEPGSPYAIGAAEGGHDAVHPELGGLAAFRRLIAAAREQDIEVALDFAVQCSPDHPWIEQHPGWFRWRPDGTIRYAENPPKKYEDIVGVDFYAEAARPDLWLALRDVVLFWVKEGVKIFRVDNPHTKPLPFWQWLIADVRREHPEVIFLSEAFTRPAMMYRLAKIGFTQSYTYFTWRNGRDELQDYLTELTRSAPRDFFRPHFFVNTPDINPWFLQSSGRPGFIIRAALATTLSGLWGMYSGFELCESEPVPGKEEYLNSEKYELRPRDWQAPGNIIDVITRLNRIRRDNPALHTHHGVQFIDPGNPQILYFAKCAPHANNFLLIAISVDPHQGQGAMLPFPAALFGMEDEREFEVEELMRDQRYHWFNEPQHWYFNPDELPLAIWRLRPQRAPVALAVDADAHDLGQELVSGEEHA